MGHDPKDLSGLAPLQLGCARTQTGETHLKLVDLSTCRVDERHSVCTGVAKIV